MDQSAPFEEEVLEARIVDIEMTSAVPSHRRMGSAGEGRREGTGAEEKDADMDAVRKPSMMWSEGATESTSTMSSAATSLSPEAKQAYAKGLGVGISEAINALSLCNLALPLAYFCVGFGGSFIDTPLKVYVINHLNEGADKLQVLKTVKVLPWSFKIFAGLLTDCVPVFGMRRKPYFLLGWLIYFAANMSLAVAGDPDLKHLIAGCFLSAVGYVLADVAADSIVVERSRLEPLAITGHMQSIVIIIKHLGTFTGNILGTLVYNQAKWGWGLDLRSIFFLHAFMPIVLVLPLTYSLVDSKGYHGVRSLTTQLTALWRLVRRRTVWKPMAFVAWYNLCHIPCAAWEPFLIKGLGFKAFQMGILSTAGALFSFLGCWFYKAFLLEMSWRSVYIMTSIVGTVFSVIQILLILRVNLQWGIGDLWFAMGDEVIGDFIMAIHILPLINMLLMLCPEGAEGTSFAMITTLGNVARAASSNLGAMLVRIWDVSNKSIKQGHYEGVWKLRLLTALIQLVGLIPAKLMPHGKEHMARKRDYLDLWGGVGFLGFLVAAWSWTIIVSVLKAT